MWLTPCSSTSRGAQPQEPRSQVLLRPRSPSMSITQCVWGGLLCRGRPVCALPRLSLALRRRGEARLSFSPKHLYNEFPGSRARRWGPPRRPARGGAVRGRRSVQWAMGGDKRGPRSSDVPSVCLLVSLESTLHTSGRTLTHSHTVTDSDTHQELRTPGGPSTLYL